MSLSSRLSSSARLSGYAALATSAAASTASAGVQIVNLPSPAVYINLGVAVGQSSAHHQAKVFGSITTVPAGSNADNGSAFFIGRWFGASSTISSLAAGGIWTDGGPLGPLAEGATGYFGFRLPVPDSSDKVYGWIEATVSGGTFEVSRWAYETVVNTSIVTPGASNSGPVPGLGGLAALALGAGGVRSRRSRVA